jgi:short-subunit dehydrogenase
VEKHDWRPVVASRQIHVGRDHVAVDMQQFATDGRGWLQRGLWLALNTRMISQTFWNGKSVIVSGGSSGIGREIARAAAAAGARVGLVARRTETLAEVVAEIRAAGGVAEAVACDVTDPAAVVEAVRRLEEHLGPTAVAVASAGLHRATWPLDAARARAVIDANVNGTTNLLAAVLPGMLDRGRGHLCGVASLAAVVGLRKNAAYSASKAAVLMLLESLRVDCRPFGIMVTTAFPGYVDTPMITTEERAAGIAMPASEAATRILRAIERGRAEVWFPRWTAFQARLLRQLPPTIRDMIVRRLPPMEEA